METFKNCIIIAILLAIAVGIFVSLYKAKKRGDACIGCPYAKQCKKSRRNVCGEKKENNR